MIYGGARQEVDAECKEPARSLLDLSRGFFLRMLAFIPRRLGAQTTSASL